jgi:predicted dinucleotide-binding enzyme
MKVGILGSGDVGQALGRGLVARGHEVKMGSRERINEKAAKWAAEAGAKASTGDFAEAARFGELVILATAWAGAENALRLAGAENLAGKVLMDVTNPLVFPSGGPPALALGHTDSGGEQVQRWVPKARVVKAFNSVGFAHMVDPKFPGGPPDMFISGNDADAKAAVADIVKSFGWGVIDVGGIEGARLLEPLCILWITYGMRTKSWNHAFKMLRR